MASSKTAAVPFAMKLPQAEVIRALSVAIRTTTQTNKSSAPAAGKYVHLLQESQQMHATASPAVHSQALT